MNKTPLALALLLLGCASPPLERFAASAGRFAAVSTPHLLKAYEGELAVCMALEAPRRAPCVAEVRDHWAGFRIQLQDLRERWCDFEPAKCPADLRAPEVSK